MILSFFITNIENDRCNVIGTNHVRMVNSFGNLKAEIFEGIKGEEAYEFFKTKNINYLNPKYFSSVYTEELINFKYEKIPGVAGCFASHYKLWEKCLNINEKIGIFEYDAFQRRKLKEEELNFNGFLYLSGWRNFYGNPDEYYENRTDFGIHEYLGYNKWGYQNTMSGTHAYIIRPEEAQILIDNTHNKGWFPVDRFMSTDLNNFKKYTTNPPAFIIEDSLNLSNKYRIK